MTRAKLSGLIIGAAALVSPFVALADSQLVITTQTASGSSIPSQTASVTVNASGASFGSPGSSNSVSYTTGFNNDNRTVNFYSGSYSVSVSSISNYTYSYSSGCNGSQSSGLAYCTITAYSSGTSGNGNLMVYVVVNNNGYNSGYSPSQFTVNVSGSNASPSSFQGSGAGTRVYLSLGNYSVNPQTQSGWTYSTTGDCSGYTNGSDSHSCTVTYTSTNNNNCYNNGYNNCNSNNYNGNLTCNPSYQQAAVNGNVAMTATGGNGGYFIWTSGSYTYNGNGATLNAWFSTPGPHTITVTSNGQTAVCTVNVVGSGYGLPTQPGYPGNYLPPNYYPQYPHLPNTGFAPIALWQYLLAALMLAGFGSLVFYVRNKGLSRSQ